MIRWIESWKTFCRSRLVSRSGLLMGVALAGVLAIGSATWPVGQGQKDSPTVQHPAVERSDQFTDSTSDSDPVDSKAMANDGSAVSEAGTDLAPAPSGQASPTTFNGRPIRKNRVITMLVTGYCPDERSCGVWAEWGTTASGKSIKTNGMKLVAADTGVLPFGTVISVPGYHAGEPVPVLDRGGKIKGDHIDLLFPTRAEAKKWGARRLRVIVWEYADGK